MTGVTIAQIGDDTAIVVASSGDNVTIVQGVEAAGPPGAAGSLTGTAGGDLTGTYPNPTIATGAVTSAKILDGTIVDGDVNASAGIALSKLATQAATTILGNATAGAAVPTALTAAQVKTLLAIATGDVSGLGTVATLASDTDGTLAANSDSRVATQKATKTYADGMVPKSTVTTKGDLIAATGSAAVARVGVGSDGKALFADSTQSAGVGWGYPVPASGDPKNGSTTYYVLPGVKETGATTSLLAANTRYYLPLYLATPATCDQLAVEQTAAGAAGKLFRFGLIAADKWWQPTGSALIDSGNVAADGANGVKTYTPGSPVALSAGRYLAIIHSDGAPTFRAVSGSVAGANSYQTTLGATPIAGAWRKSLALGAIDSTAWDTVTGVSPGTSVLNCVWLRFSDPAP